MADSYLFPGRDPEQLSPYQRELEKLYDRSDRPGNRLTPEQFFQSPDYLNFVKGKYGDIPVPPGATVLSQTPGEVRYKDAEGYEHILRRNIAGGAEGGQVVEQTNRPPILPPQGAQADLFNQLNQGVSGLSAAQLANLEAVARGERPAAFDPGIQGDLDQINTLAQQLQQGPQLQALDPQTAAALKAISDAEQMRLGEQFDQQQGSAIAQLYGNRVNQSSIAGQNLGQLQQAQGLVSAQQLADASGRQLTVQQFLAQQQQQQRELALQALLGGTGAKLESFKSANAASQAQSNALMELLNSLSGQQNTRDIASAGLGLDQKRLDEETRQANLRQTLGLLGAQEATEKRQAENSGYKKFLAGVNAASGVASSIAGFGA